MNYITIVFTNGMTLTRRVSDLHSISLFRDRVGSMTPEGREVIVNWDNVAYVREAVDHEIESAHLYERITGGSTNGE